MPWPDIVVCFGVLGAIAALLEADARERTRARIPWLILSALLALVAYLAREIALPMLALFAAIYLCVRRLRPDHLPIPAWCSPVSRSRQPDSRRPGDPLFRIHVFRY